MAKLIFLFPGQGSQSVGMGKDLIQAYPDLKQTFEEASDALGFDMAKLCFEDSEKQLNLTEYTQPAILTVSTAVFRLLKKNFSHINCEFAAGHSLGEYSALVALGALQFSDALRAVHFRGQAMQRAVPVGMGAMAAYVGSSPEKVQELCQRVNSLGNSVEIVNFNSPQQLVLSGHKVAVAQVSALIAEEKLGRAIELPVSAPFHSSLMQNAAREMAQFLEKVPLLEFEGKIVANIDAQIYSSGQYTKEILITQIASPVLWTQSLNTLHKERPEALWIEVGPGKVLQGLLKKTLEKEQCLVTNNLQAVEECFKQLNT